MKKLLLAAILAGFVGQADAAWRVSKVSPYLVVKYTAKGIKQVGKGIGVATVAIARHA